MIQLTLTQLGSLQIPADCARTYFPEDSLVVLAKPPELWLLPIHRSQSGGLLLKQRNRVGDRSVVIWEYLFPDTVPGPLEAFWDAEHHALRVSLNQKG